MNTVNYLVVRKEYLLSNYQKFGTYFASSLLL